MKKICLILPFLTLPVYAAIDLNAVQDAARSRNVTQLVRMADAAKGDLLEMYPRYILLTTQITTLDPADARVFLARYGNTPQAERFRAEWLLELGRRMDWASFLAEYPKLESPSTELRCFFAQASLNQGNSQPLNSVRANWFSGQNQPAACAPAFDALFAQGKLGSEDAWNRLRLALMENNIDLAAAIAPRISDVAPFTAKQLANLRANPEKNWPQSAQTRAGREAALYVLNRIARSAPETAAQNLASVESGWPESDRLFAWRMIGVIAAKKLHPSANAWLERGKGSDDDADSRAWAIRAALRVADWQRVLERIDALPEDERNDSAWRYWRGRALKELGATQEANQQLISAANGHDFYSLLARDDLGTILEPAEAQYRASEDEIRQIPLLPGVQRASALFEQNWRTEAVREWNWAMRGQSDQVLLAAAEYARRQGWYDRAIYAAERTRQLHNFSLRYLTPYRDIIDSQAREEGLEPAWVYGLMRQESRFVSDAKSRVGAGGLMQLMPATAKWVANKLGWKKYNADDVHDIATNVTLGSRYLGDVWKQLSNSQVLASAGYNAGPGRARAWQSDTPLDAAIYIENIPFTETRDYVKKVMTNAVHYAQIFGTAQTSLKTRIGTIPSKQN